MNDNNLNIARGRKRWIAGLLGGGGIIMAVLAIITIIVEANKFSDYALCITGFLISTILPYAGVFLEIRVYSDRIERSRLSVKTIKYDNVDHVHIPKYLTSRVNVWEKGGTVLSCISIHRELKDWQKVGAALLGSLPETVEVTGDETLKNELLELWDEMEMEDDERRHTSDLSFT